MFVDERPLTPRKFAELYGCEASAVFRRCGVVSNVAVKVLAPVGRGYVWHVDAEKMAASLAERPGLAKRRRPPRERLVPSGEAGHAER